MKYCPLEGDTLARKQAGKKTLLRAFYTQLIMHGFALGYSMGNPGRYAEGLAIAKGPLGKAAINLAAFEAAERDLDDTRQLALGGIITEPTYALIGEAGPELVIPLPNIPNLPGIPKPRTRKKTKRDRILSRELKIMNKRARKKNGSFKAGWNQRKIMQRAQAATKKIMGKGGTKKGQVRKTARRAYEK